MALKATKSWDHLTRKKSWMARPMYRHLEMEFSHSDIRRFMTYTFLLLICMEI